MFVDASEEVPAAVVIVVHDTYGHRETARIGSKTKVRQKKPT